MASKQSVFGPSLIVVAMTALLMCASFPTNCHRRSKWTPSWRWKSVASWNLSKVKDQMEVRGPPTRDSIALFVSDIPPDQEKIPNVCHEPTDEDPTSTVRLGDLYFQVDENALAGHSLGWVDFTDPEFCRWDNPVVAFTARFSRGDPGSFPSMVLFMDGTIARVWSLEYAPRRSELSDSQGSDAGAVSEPGEGT